jgi:hypothetical protein
MIDDRQRMEAIPGAFSRLASRPFSSQTVCLPLMRRFLEQYLAEGLIEARMSEQ